MFVNKTRLPHLLSPGLYSSPEQYEREISCLFEPTWHAVASVQDVANDGDFLTIDLLGRPLIVRNFGGEICAFLNVCTHRHCLLTHELRGTSPNLVCQYHGWVYTKDGRTSHIPDAQSFKPLPGGPERLRKFRAETRGPLVFVSLADNGPSLDDYLGPLRSACDEFPATRWQQSDSWDYEFKANWKIPVENTIESYHVPIIHPKTLVRFGTEEQMTHEIYDRGTVMKSPIAAPAFYHRLSNWLLPLLEPGCSHLYRLHHVFPNLFLIRIDAMLQVMSVIPTSAETCRLTVHVFTLRAAREGWRSKLMTSGWGRFKTWIIKKVLNEDAPLYPDLHAGMKSSPFQGTISTREELVFAFQDYVQKNCEMSPDIRDLQPRSGDII